MTPSRHTWLLLLLFSQLLVACDSEPGPTPKLTPERLILEPGRMMRFPVNPVPGPTEENPVITLRLTMTDIDTGAPVAANVAVDGEFLKTNVTQIDVALPGQLTKRPIPIEVQAADYQTWSLEARWSLDHSRIFLIPVRLKRAQPEAWQRKLQSLLKCCNSLTCPTVSAAPQNVTPKASLTSVIYRAILCSSEFSIVNKIDASCF